MDEPVVAVGRVLTAVLAVALWLTQMVGVAT
jgi:hypothetical protein